MKIDKKCGMKRNKERKEYERRRYSKYRSELYD